VPGNLRLPIKFGDTVEKPVVHIGTHRRIIR
jgi:hypothetical protein